MLELKALSKSVGRDRLLAQATLSFPEAAVTAVLGLPAGAGQRFARLLTGQERADKGQALIDGKPAAQSSARTRIVAAPSPADARRSAREILVRSLKEARTPSQALGPETERLAVAAGIAPQLDVRLMDLDDATRGRVLLAAAFVGGPRVVVVDGLLSGLAPADRHVLLAGLSAMAADAAVSVVWLATNPLDALAIGGQVLALSGGRILTFGPAGQVIEAPQSLAIAGAVAEPALNRLRISLADGARRLLDGARFEPPSDFALPDGCDCVLAFRPQDVALERRDASAVRFAVRMQGRIQADRTDYARLAIAGETWLAQVSADGAPPDGVTLSAFVPRDRIMLFRGDEAGERIG